MDSLLAKNKYSNTLLPSNVISEIVTKLRVLRKKNKYSQQELARRYGVSLGSIKRFERTGKVSLESLLKIAHVLGRLQDFQQLFAYDETLEIVRLKFKQ